MAYGATMSSRAVTPEPTPQGSNGGGPAAHRRVEADFDLHLEDPNRPGWCATCGCAWECPGSVVREPVPPVSLTRGGFILS